MEKLYLQHISKSDRLKFHYRELFDDLRDIKLALSILFCAIAVFETIQSIALPSEVTIESKGESFITGIAYCLACCCYLVTMLKFFENRSPRILRIRYGLLVLAVLIATGGAFTLMSESHNIIIINNPKDFVLTIISQKTELWIILLVDLIVPVWPLKLLLPIAFWSPVIVEYYRSDMPYKETLWVRFILSFSYIFCIFALKGHIKWRNFQKHLNLQAWSEIQTSILNKMPEAIGVVNTDYKIIYSNSSFKGLCNNNIKEIGQRIVDIKKVTAFRTGNNQTDSEPKKSRIFFDETKHVFMNEEDPRNNINAMSDHFLDLNDLLEEVMYYLSNGSFNEDDYVIFKGKYKTLDGSPPLSYEVKISPLLNFKKCIIILSDTTQREKAADLEGVNQYKDKLLATVSHDLRAPINGTLTFLQETLEHQDVPSTIKEQFLIPAQRSCQFLLHLVNDVLDFSQINAQKLRMSFESLSIAETIRNCHHLLQVQANHKKIAFPLILDEHLPKYFTTDHNRLSQIILNLLTNAIKFTSKGEVSLKAKVINAFMIEITVADTGIGIKDEDQKRLFQEFTRIDYAQPNMNTRGVGLGLVIANELAKMVGPTTEESGIKVQSIYEQGSTFSFLVRDKSFQRDRSLKEEKKARMGASGYQQFDNEIRKKSKGNSIVKHGMCPSRTGELTSTDQFNSMVHIPPSSKFNVRNPNSEFESAVARPIRVGPLIGRVLVVDDDPFNILALESQLKRYGLIVDAAYNGQEAIEKIIKNRDRNDHSKESQRTSEEGGTDDVPEARYDIIFMDCEMPIMNGVEGSKILSGMMRKGEIETIPIIGCTGHRDSEIIEKCFENGMSDVLNKPVAREKLRECLHEFLELDI